MSILVLAILILTNAFFAASEISLISLNDNKVKHLAEEGDKKFVMLHKLLSEPSRFLATIQIGITLAGFLASAFAADSFSASLAEALQRAGVPLPLGTLDTISVIIITLILSYFTLVFGELVPKRLGMKKAEAISKIAVRPLTILSTVTAPFVKLLTGSTNVFVRLFGVNPHEHDEKVTEEEIRMMIDVGRESGTIREMEQVMIDNIFEFDNKTIVDIMTHRTSIVGIPREATMPEVIQLLLEEKYSRYPVYAGSIDNIVGVLHVKDSITFIQECDKDSFNIMDYVRKPYLVPSTRKTNEAFKDMQKNRIHIAVVIDEYGGTAGIVTIEDLIEEIVGNIQDEHDEVEEVEIVKFDESTYMMSGTTLLDDVQVVLKTDLPIDEYETLSGFIIGQLGRIPGRDERPEVEFEGVFFKVEKADAKRIMMVKVAKV